MPSANPKFRSDASARIFLWVRKCGRRLEATGDEILAVGERFLQREKRGASRRDLERVAILGNETETLVQFAQDVRLAAEGLDLLGRVEPRLAGVAHVADDVPRAVELQRALGSVCRRPEKLDVAVERDRALALIVEDLAQAGRLLARLLLDLAHGQNLPTPCGRTIGPPSTNTSFGVTVER